MSYPTGHRGTPMERFMRKVNKLDNGCWQWTRRLDKKGYGRFSFGPGDRTTSNRAAYILFKGPIPDDLDTDHICRNPTCVNPEHLEAVSHRENILRGEAPQAINARKTHCWRGHDLSLAYTRKDRIGRECGECRKIRRRRH